MVSEKAPKRHLVLALAVAAGAGKISLVPIGDHSKG
jgi:hypothetical protein